MLKNVARVLAVGALCGGIAFGVTSGLGCDDSSGNCPKDAVGGRPGSGGATTGSGGAGGMAGGAGAGGGAGSAGGSAGSAGGSAGSAGGRGGA